MTLRYLGETTYTGSAVLDKVVCEKKADEHPQ